MFASETDTSAQTPQSNEAKLVLTAVDKDLNFVSTLNAEALQVFEDGKPRKILALKQITDQPVSLAILIDASASQERTLPGQKLAASAFVVSVIRGGKDQAAVATFTSTLKFEQELTNNVGLLQQAIARVRFVAPPGYIGLGMSRPLPVMSKDAQLAGSTAVWDSVSTACDDLAAHSKNNSRRAIILLTDGVDTSSKTKMSDAIKRAIAGDVAVYSIGIADDKNFGSDKGALRKLSERTGGRGFFPKKIGDLQTIFAQIQQELRSQYLITYESSAVGQLARTIKIELVSPAQRKQDLQLAYRRLSAWKP